MRHELFLVVFGKGDNRH